MAKPKPLLLTRTVEFRRYSTDKSLTSMPPFFDGVQLAEVVGRVQLKARSFTSLFVSPTRHTGQTLNAFARGAGDFPNVMPNLFLPYMRTGRSPAALKFWNGICAEAERGRFDAMEAAKERCPDEFEALSKHSARTFISWLGEQPRNINALVVGHSPFIEMIGYGFLGVRIPQLQPCDGYRLFVDETGVRRLLTGSESPDLLAANVRARK
jgi:broad specificity phosphatase PhoE